MRQKLKNKTSKTAGNSSKTLLKKSSASSFPNLKLGSLFFDSSIGKEAWISGIKQHARVLSDSLLNNDIGTFEAYLNTSFTDYAKKANVPTKGLLAINQ